MANTFVCTWSERLKQFSAKSQIPHNNNMGCCKTIQVVHYKSITVKNDIQNTPSSLELGEFPVGTTQVCGKSEAVTL